MVSHLFNKIRAKNRAIIELDSNGRLKFSSQVVKDQNPTHVDTISTVTEI